jgi:hypothetical protein
MTQGHTDAASLTRLEDRHGRQHAPQAQHCQQPVRTESVGLLSTSRYAVNTESVLTRVQCCRGQDTAARAHVEDKQKNAATMSACLLGTGRGSFGKLAALTTVRTKGMCV